MSDYIPPPPSMPQQNSNTALLSLIAGISGLTIFPLVGSIIAVILGHMAKGEIARSAGTLSGDSAATWGLVLGYIGIALGVIGMCIAGAFVLLPLCLVMFSIPMDTSSLPLLLSLL